MDVRERGMGQLTHIRIIPQPMPKLPEDIHTRIRTLNLFLLNITTRQPERPANIPERPLAVRPAEFGVLRCLRLAEVNLVVPDEDPG
jgi:hypothetical protein